MAHVSLFPYARTGLFCVLKAAGVVQREVLVSSYTCVVVPQEVRLSGNSPRFFEPADGALASPSQHGVADVEIVTHMFGRRVDIDGITVRPKLLIEDSCLSWSSGVGRARGDVVLLSLNLSKQLTTLWGGIVATDDANLHAAIERTWESLRRRPRAHGGVTFLKLAAALGLYSRTGYTLAHAIKRITGWGNQPNYSLDAAERPNNAFAPLTPAQCGLAERQLRRLPQALERRREIARLYMAELAGMAGIELPLAAEIADPSHFVIRTRKAPALRRALYALGVNTGNPIGYTCAQLPMFADAPGASQDYSGSADRAADSVALPFHLRLADRDVRRICERLHIAWARTCPP